MLPINHIRKIDLSGLWLYKTDEADVGMVQGFYKESFDEYHTFILPGSTCDNSIGKKHEWYEKYEKSAVRAPREKYEYVAPLWLQTNFYLSEDDMSGMDVFLYLERVNLSSMLFIDGVQVAREIISLSSPHIYDLTGKIFRLSPGHHTLTLRIDNRDLVHFGDMASGYSIDTQGLWNGAIGEIGFRLIPKVRIDDVQIHLVPGTEDEIELHIITKCEQHSPLDVLPAVLRVSVTTPDGETLTSTDTAVELFTSRERIKIRYNLSQNGASHILRWNEFTPLLYRANIELLIDDETSDCTSIVFGLRTPEVRGKDLMLDKRCLSLRGTINCAQYPITGYPPMDEATWISHFSEIKAFGLNHVRFHAWCPPDAAFSAADKLGVYLQVEMPMWINRDICPYEVGDDPIHESFYFREAKEIRKCYGNHPSFLMFSNGNENMGDFALLEDIITMLKANDKRCFYTLTSNFDHPVHDCEDYLSAFEMAHTPSRIQFLHDKVAEGSYINYNEVVSKVPVPVISFEVGQYCVYPDVDCVEDYTGNMLPVNFDIIRKLMKEKGVYEKLKDYIKASGAMAAKLYKEDIEAVLRTPHFGGIQLLSASDYTGQSTATVGIMDVFFRDKEIIEKDVWRGFCGEVVPLFEAKRIFENTENLIGRISLYDHGETPILKPEYRVTIVKIRNQKDNEVIFNEVISCSTDNTAVLSYDLCCITEPAMLRIYISVEGNSKHYTNFWNVFVYPATGEKDSTYANTEPKIKCISVDEFAKRMEKSTNNTRYIPVFWSPVHFPSKDSYGAMIDNCSDILLNFPTDCYPDYQWKNLLDHAVGMDISELDVKPIVEMVPNFADNTRFSPLFETELDGKTCIVNGFDLERGDIVTSALRTSIMNYLFM